MALTKTTYSMIQGAVFNVLDYGADKSGGTNSRVACQAAIDAAVAAGGGAVYFPAGTYLINSVAGLDTIPNGLLIPDTNGVFNTNNGVMLFGDGIDTVIQAGNTNMCVIRNSRLYTTIRDLKIDGGPKTSVIGLGVIPESITQTTELVSNSFMVVDNIHIENCRRGMMFQPGPTVGGSDSGCFYHTIRNLVSNLNDEHVLMLGDVTAANNRTTRTTFFKCTFLRGNTGINLLKGTEIDFVSCYWELISQGTVPYATPVAFYYGDTNPSLINIIGGYAEACTRGVVAVSAFAASYVSLFGYAQSMAEDATYFSMNKHLPKRLVISKPNNFELVELSFGNASFVGFIADPLQANSKTLDLTVNGATKVRWAAAGSETFYGTDGNIVTSSTGRVISFGYDGSNTIQANGGASAQMFLAATNTVAISFGGSVVEFRAATLDIIPQVNNTIDLGDATLAWKDIYTVNPVTVVSDPRLKTDIEDLSFGLNFINKLRPVAYKLKAGGAKVVGQEKISDAIVDIDADGNEYEKEPAQYKNIYEFTPGKRTHFGLLAPEVKQACGDVDFAGFVKENIDNPESKEMLRYEEFIAPLIKAVQELSARVVELEKKLQI